MQIFLAALPILVLLGLMIGPRWSAQKAGPASWLAGAVVAGLAFGLTPAVLWVSQARGLLLSFFVLAVLWPALLLYNIVDRTGGIKAIARGLEGVIGDRGLLLVLLAWAFSALLEGLAGFGLPIAIVSPMLVALGVEPVIAVAAVAVGHAWSVTFGDMGVILQTLSGVVKQDPAVLAPAAGLALGAACLVCGLSAAQILKQGRLWLRVIALGLLMAGVQYGLAVAGLTPLAALGAGLAGLIGGVLASRPRSGEGRQPGMIPPPLAAALASYGGLALLMTLIAWPGPLRAAIFPAVWQPQFPAVATIAGTITPAGPGQAFRPFVHPGTSILCVALLSYVFYRRASLCGRGDLRAAAHATWRSAAPSSLGIIATVGLSTMMEHSGMTQLLARSLASLMGAAFPLVSPLVGMLGAFATGSNNNSNILFAPLQNNIAGLLAIDPRLLLATQTAGGALGSMIAPAKLTVGCSTVGMRGHEGDVLRHTLFYGLGIGLLLGALALLFAG
ncbi:MAG: L-lactate permease [Anaerolineaceae bacterium]|nr:L-lactate permease [Anaerolineaceae bacterium]